MTYEEIERSLVQYKYELEVSVLLPNNRVEQIHPDNVLSLTVEHQFTNNLFPITKLQISVSERIYYSIIDNIETVRIKLNLKCLTTDDAENLEDGQYFYSNILNTELKPIIDKKTPYKTKNLDSSDLEEDEMTNIEQKDTNEFNVMSLYLFKERELDLNKTLYNFIAEDVNMFGVLGYLCNIAGVKNLLISPPDNKEKYKQVIVPPGNFKETITHLQKYYGIYKKGIKTYFDFERSYILSGDIKRSPYAKGEVEHVYIYLNSIEEFESMGRFGSCLDKEKNKYYIVSPNYVQFKTHTQKTSEILGDDISIIDQDKLESDAVFYDPDTKKFNFNSVTSKVVTDNKSKSSRQKVVTNNLSNRFFNDEFQYELDKSSLELIMPLIDVNVANLTPNKRFSIIFNEEDLTYKYSGEYYLDKITYTLSKNNDNLLSLFSQALFKKI